MLSTEPVIETQKPHIVQGEGALHFRGSGVVCIRLLGTGLLDVRRGPTDQFNYTGRGTPRHFSSAHVAIKNGKGLVQIEGDDLDIVLDDASVHAALNGHFFVEVRGQGLIESPDGQRSTWGRRGGKRMFIDGERVSPAP